MMTERAPGHEDKRTDVSRQILKNLATSSSGLPTFLQRKIDFKESSKSEDNLFPIVSYKRTHDEMEASTIGLEKSNKLDIKTSWNNIYPVGSGISNLGNTCFLNSVLQCLTYTPPLANFFIERKHSSFCKRDLFCIMCELENHVVANFSKPRSKLNNHSFPIKNYSVHNYHNGNHFKSKDKHEVNSILNIVSHLKLIAKHMRLGRQEDAHEFLRFLLDGAHKVERRGIIRQIFEGNLCSEIKCLSCKNISKTIDPFLDISLDIRCASASSVESALCHFCDVEQLDKDNLYRCESSGGGCGRLTKAERRISIVSAPPILTLHLKRFQMNIPFGFAGKISREVKFECELDIKNFCKSSSKNQTSKYSLFGVLVHEGQTCDSGHYHAFVKASNGIWYSMNDLHVQQVSVNTVLRQKAYILFYSRVGENL